MVDRFIIGTLVAGTLVSGGILASTSVKADNDTAVVDEVSITVLASCSLAGTVTDQHTETIMPGNRVAGIGTTDLKATCNDFGGFDLYAVGYTGNTSGNTNLVSTTGQTIPTGDATVGNASSWAMKLTKVTDTSISYNPSILGITTGYDDYHSVPSSLTRVAQYKSGDGSSSATDQTLGSHITTTYAAYVTNTQVAGTYTGQVRYLLVHPANMTIGTYTLAYDANDGTGTMTSETGLPNYEPHTIKASTFTPPSGYEFAGWCTIQNTSATPTNPQTTCTGITYTDGGTISGSTVTAGGSMTLYAMWAAAE